MAIYNFKKDVKLYIVRGGLKYKIEIYPDISFSQTFNETTVPVKTLHTQYNMFEDAVINRANPANFAFTIPILEQPDMDIVFQLLLDYDSDSVEATIKSADIYVEANSEIHKLEKSVIESGVFHIERNGLMLLNISGSASKLYKVEDPIPGVLQAITSPRKYANSTAFGLKLDTVDMPHIVGISLEVRNDVKWLDHATLHNSLAVNSASETQFPEAFVVSTRSVSGNIQQYVTDVTNTRVSTWDTDAGLLIRAGNRNSNWILEVSMPKVVYTNRIGIEDLYVQTYDFRMTDNPNNLANNFIRQTIAAPIHTFSSIWDAI